MLCPQKMDIRINVKTDSNQLWVATVKLTCNFTITREHLTGIFKQLLTLVWNYSWHVLYYPQGTHTKLLDDL